MHITLNENRTKIQKKKKNIDEESTEEMTHRVVL